MAVDGGEELPVGLNNLYRHAAGAPLLLRGRWESEDTFLLEQIMLEQVGRYEFRITVGEAGIEFELRDATFGGEPVRFRSGAR